MTSLATVKDQHQDDPERHHSGHRSFQSLIGVFKEAFSEWQSDKAGRLAAALAYFTIFAIAPLLIVMIWVLGSVAHAYGIHHGQVRDHLIGQLAGSVGVGGAETIKTLVEAAYKPKEGAVASAIGMLVFIFAASGIFGALQDALNSIWHVEQSKKRTLIDALKDRFRSIGMIFVLALLLLLAIGANAALAGATNWMNVHIPGLALLGRAASFLLSFGLMTTLFALIFKVLPDAEVRWGDVWIGAAVTSLLFVLGEFALGLYFERSAVASTYGAAGSLVVFLLWIYYAAQILFFGAEFTKAYAATHGSRAAPNAQAA